jgi:hypothetical protein
MHSIEYVYSWVSLIRIEFSLVAVACLGIMLMAW